MDLMEDCVGTENGYFSFYEILSRSMKKKNEKNKNNYMY